MLADLILGNGMALQTESQRGATALSGLRVVDLSDCLTGAHVSQLFADFGAEVVQVERPGGSSLRASAAFAFLARGKKSVVLDLTDAAGRREAARLIGAADIVIETFRPGVTERLGLGYEQMSASNAGLVYLSITGFGASGPYAHVKGYEALVMAKIGGSHMMSPMSTREGPSFAAVPFCSFSAAQTGLHGVLAALVERGRSGRGQHVHTSLVQGIAAHDTWNWFLHLLATRYEGAFIPAPHVENGVPNSALIFRLLIALSADGQWLQFSQTSRHLYVALMDVLGMGWMFDDPEWAEIPLVPDPAKRVELWDRMLTQVRSKTVAEWQQVFDERPNVWAEPFRTGADLLDHPQLVHDGSIVEIVDPVRGLVRQPGPLARLSVTPARLDRPAPAVNEHAGEMAHWQPRAGGDAPKSVPTGDAPLAGVTVLELGMYFAAPYAGSVLADLGARVIKVEPMEGDPLRGLASFPEVGAIKVLQGKETIAIDLATPEGRHIVYELTAQSDIVIQSFRAGVAERLGVDGPSLLAVNPDLVYLNSPGYGVDGPCGHRPAYAPTIAAASGIAWRMTGVTMPADNRLLSVEDTKRAAVRLVAATNASFAQCDGLSALGVATAALLGLVARERGAGGQQLFTSMLSTAAHANCEDVVDYADRPPTPRPDDDLYGLAASYRLYETASGWVFLAVPKESEWAALTAHPDFAEFAADGRFATASVRVERDEELAKELGAIFATRTASEWETTLLAADVGCVAVTAASVESVLMSEEFGRAGGLVADVDHPMLGKHPRLAALVDFSRSRTRVGAATVIGEHTDQVLAQLDYTPEQRRALASDGVIALAV